MNRKGRLRKEAGRGKRRIIYKSQEEKKMKKLKKRMQHTKKGKTPPAPRGRKHRGGALLISKKRTLKSDPLSKNQGYKVNCVSKDFE